MITNVLPRFVTHTVLKDEREEKFRIAKLISFIFFCREITMDIVNKCMSCILYFVL